MDPCEDMLQQIGMYVINFIARDFLRTKYNSGHAGNRIKTRNSFSEFINGDKSTTTMASLTSSDLEEITTEYQGNFSNLINTGLLKLNYLST